jgi:hypothetical protein
VHFAVFESATVSTGLDLGIVSKTSRPSLSGQSNRLQSCVVVVAASKLIRDIELNNGFVSGPPIFPISIHHSQRDTSFTQAIQHGASKRQAAQSMCSANFSRVWHGKISKNDIIVGF